MPLHSDTSPRPAGVAGEDEIDRRLRLLGSTCAALAVAVLATAAAVGWAALRASASDFMASPPGDSFLAALCAMVLVLLASAAHGRILRRQAAAEIDDAAEMDGVDDPDGAATAGRPRPPAAAVTASRLSAYTWATGAWFGMLAVAAALGAVAAAGGRAPLYGLVVSVAVLFAMVARWPRRSGFEMAFRDPR
jgi:hypothetical protein